MRHSPCGVTCMCMLYVEFDRCDAASGVRNTEFPRTNQPRFCYARHTYGHDFRSTTLVLKARLALVSVAPVALCTADYI